MITLEKLKELQTTHQMPIFENIVREYLQHIFLSNLYSLNGGTENIMFKGGTALRIVYNSPRFSEDLDFSLFNVQDYQAKKFIEERLEGALKRVEQIGIKTDIGSKTDLTTEGYRGEAVFDLHDMEIAISIEISRRNGRPVKGEVKTIASDFLPPYNLYQLPTELLVSEKINALFERSRGRDFYDLYFMLRKGLVGTGQKEGLARAKEIVEKTDISFKTELENLLPRNQQAILSDFKNTLLGELNRQLATIS